MKKCIKFLLAFLFVFCIFTITNSAKASNNINKISMDIAIDNSGTATVTEVWNCSTSSGTEVYHPYYNLGNSKITMLSVTDGTTKYENIGTWKTSGTLKTKANKFGINKISNGVELCWGMNTYGKHNYTVQYQITNFVSELKDAQMIYWTLIPYEFSNPIGSVYIKIHSNFDIADTTDVWGYGNYGGTAYVYDGYIEMQSAGTLSSNEYMTILVKFPLGTFNLSNKLNYNFEHYYDMAQEGAIKYEKPSTSSSNSFSHSLFIIPFILNMFIMTFLPIFLCIFISSRHNKEQFNYGKEGKRIGNDIPYFRDIPLDGDLEKAYFLAYQYKLLKNDTDILGAIILKWLKDSLITIENTREGILNRQSIKVTLNYEIMKNMTNTHEKDLYNMLYEASKDGILEDKEFKKWSKEHFSSILGWFETMKRAGRAKFMAENLITTVEKKRALGGKSYIYTATPELKEKAIQLAGLKKYLNDYTLIKEREAIEVHLLEWYLIFAQMLGIAKKVAKQFEDIYPQVIEQSNISSYNNLLFISMYANTWVHDARAAKSAHDAAVARANSYSSGGGGFSSGGGGGGSFGGGGGRRRFPLKYFPNFDI